MKFDQFLGKIEDHFSIQARNRSEFPVAPEDPTIREECEFAARLYDAANRQKKHFESIQKTCKKFFDSNMMLGEIMESETFRVNKYAHSQFQPKLFEEYLQDPENGLIDVWEAHHRYEAEKRRMAPFCSEIQDRITVTVRDPQ